MDKQALLKKMRRQIFLMGRFKIPLIGYTKPQLIAINDESVKVTVQLKRRTRNHLNSMYFGALAIGADVAGGIHAFYYAEQHQKDIAFAFKGMSCEFHQRAESDCTFVSEDGKKVEAAILASIASGERVNETTKVSVFNEQQELVATFELIISVKCK